MEQARKGILLWQECREGTFFLISFANWTSYIVDIIDVNLGTGSKVGLFATRQTPTA
jgi:hypothetical protein